MLIFLLGIAIVIAVAVIGANNVNNNNGTPLDKQNKSDDERLKDLNRKIFASHFGFSNKGETGENIIEYDLINLHFYKKIIRNAYIPYNGGTSEIDLILLTEFGIYVIESKNYSGWIFGSENNKYWTVSYNKNTKERLYNPILQNNSHIRALTNYLQITSNGINSLIIFGGGAELKKVPQNTPTRQIIYDYQIIDMFDYEMTKTKIFTADYIEKMYSLLEPTTHVTETVKQQHVAEVQRYK
ncbi:MAG: NERD domain-containing protein [Ruminococcus sp.]|nr:NERD domain-containing protein [Ruminococcus sp.]MCM1381167.1 NERD domain-containing protein [Muribaculaceae bacterium]MCM1479658.1 NERD domain-containing protein [Muribaculaceae bacterium]